MSRCSGAAWWFTTRRSSRACFREQVRERLNGLSSLRVVESYLKHIEQERPDADFLARMTYLELKLRLPELLLMRVDKITMATSVEARVPFWIIIWLSMRLGCRAR